VLSKRSMLGLFTIAIVSSLLVVSSFAGTAFATKKRVYKEDDDLSTDIDSLKSSSVLSEDTDDKKKNLNSESLSRCEAAAVADGHLTVTEQRECYRLACNDDD
jgi:hypothetical protein